MRQVSCEEDEVKRPSRDEALMQMAELVAQRGTCERKQVGVVFARQGRVLMTGYNGAPAGMKHCDHSHDRVSIETDNGVAIGWSVNGKQQDHPGCELAIHAEANAIAYAARTGVALEGSTLYSTCGPCPTCAKLLVNVGIRMLYYLQPYRDPAGRDLLLDLHIGVMPWGPIRNRKERSD
jgi:dCMP deaminase